METLEKIFIDFIKKKGLRYTPERKTVLEGILSIGSHFDADILYDFLKNKREDLSMATIYRSIPLFIESGILKKSPRSRGREQYELIYGHDHHDHLICLSCGKIIEFKHEIIEKLQNEVCIHYNFQLIDHSLSIRGYCRDCRTKKQETLT
ncbi:MAG: transcriptional repressor [Spirochaetales bacterium]|nr:transcriptional repressor [Spirochaetales bacterium]